MSSRYIRGNAVPLNAPVLTAQAVAVGDLIALSAGNVVRAQDFAWSVDLPTTQTNFAAAFLGVSGQRKDAAVARCYGNSTDNLIRVDAASVWEFDTASASYNVGDLVGAAKDTGLALLSQTVAAVATEAASIGRVVEATTSSTKVKVQITSTKAPLARKA